MKHSDRIRWFERAYDAIRRDLLPEAPGAVTLTIGFPTKKKSGATLCVGECCYDVMTAHGEVFGGENLVTLHPIQGDDLVAQLATLVHEMIHHALEPGVSHKKPFQVIAKRVGLLKPWTATTPDEDLQHTLRGILLEVEADLGYVPVGYYVPKPPAPKKPSRSVRLRCRCDVPRTLVVHEKALEKGSFLCGRCREEFTRRAGEVDGL